MAPAAAAPGGPDVAPAGALGLTAPAAVTSAPVTVSRLAASSAGAPGWTGGTSHSTSPAGTPAPAVWAGGMPAGSPATTGGPTGGPSIPAMPTAGVPSAALSTGMPTATAGATVSRLAATHPVAMPIASPSAPAQPAPVAPPEPVVQTVTIQRVEAEPAAPPAPAGSGSTPAPPAPPAGGQAPEELLAKLFDPLLRRLRAELRIERDRRGSLTDLRH
jgi:hypothetical protein